MKYMGSKARHAKHILPIVLANRKPGQWYVEPFVGGANMIDKVDGNRIGADVHPHLIALWKAVSEGWVPPEFVSEDDYSNAKRANNIDAYTAYVGFAFSFGAKFFGGYARNVAGQKGSVDNMRNQSRMARNSLLKQSPSLRGVDFRLCPYNELEIPPQSIVYCDPPYAGTTKYATNEFDHDNFWEWCRQKTNDGHSVFVSEYSAPDDWVCVWQNQVTANFDSNRNGGSSRVERLFAHHSQAKDEPIGGLFS